MLIWPQGHRVVSLIHKYVNLKESYNQDIKEKVTNEKVFKKKTGFTWSPRPQGVFQIQSPISDVNFSNNILIIQVRINDRETELYSTFETSQPLTSRTYPSIIL